MRTTEFGLARRADQSEGNAFCAVQCAECRDEPCGGTDGNVFCASVAGERLIGNTVAQKPLLFVLRDGDRNPKWPNRTKSVTLRRGTLPCAGSRTVQQFQTAQKTRPWCCEGVAAPSRFAQKIGNPQKTALKRCWRLWAVHWYLGLGRTPRSPYSAFWRVIFSHIALN